MQETSCGFNLLKLGNKSLRPARVLSGHGQKRYCNEVLTKARSATCAKQLLQMRLDEACRYAILIVPAYRLRFGSALLNTCNAMLRRARVATLPVRVA